MGEFFVLFLHLISKSKITKLLKHLSQIQGKPWESAGNSFFKLGEEPSLDGQEASNDIQIF